MSQAPHPRMHGLTHVAGGSDPVPFLPGFPEGDTLDEKLAAIAEAWWKLDETTGIVAHDSSGNGHDLTVPTSYTAPLWGQPAGPPGTTTAKWVDTTVREANTMPAFNDDFTAGLWINMLVLPVGAYEVIGQGASNHSSTGWAVTVWPDGIDRKFAVYVNGHVLLANSAAAANTWYFVAAVRDTGTWKLYINGLLQAATISDSPGISTALNTWLGNDGWTLLSHPNALRDSLLSYAFIVDRPMSGTELSDLLAAAGAPPVTDHTGEVLTVGDDGQPTWQPPGIEVSHGDGEPDPEPVTSIWAPSGSTSVSGWHLDAHYETVVLYDSSPGRFDVPSMKWVRVPFNTVRIWRTWEPTVGATSLKTEWLPDDRGLITQAEDGLLHIAAGMEGTPDADGHHQTVSSWSYSPEWPFLDWRKLPNGGDPVAIDNYVRAARVVDLSHGFVLRDYGVGPTAREFFEWSMFDPADGTPEWVSYTVDNPYPVYPVWPERPLVLPPPYPKMSDTESGGYYAPQKTFRMKTTLAAGSNLCVQAWQDAPWLLRFSTDTYRIPYPGLSPKWGLRPYLTISYSYDPETIDHTTGTLVG